MPVRIYDIAKRLEITSKEVLTKAKELNITNARVASSSIDKITAEYLEDAIAKELKPAEPEPEVAEVPAEEAAPSGPVLIVAPEEKEEEEPETEEAAEEISEEAEAEAVEEAEPAEAEAETEAEPEAESS